MIYKILIVFTSLFALAELVVYLTWRQFDKPKYVNFYMAWIAKEHQKLLIGLSIAGLLICLCLYFIN